MKDTFSIRLGYDDGKPPAIKVSITPFPYSREVAQAAFDRLLDRYEKDMMAWDR